MTLTKPTALAFQFLVRLITGRFKSDFGFPPVYPTWDELPLIERIETGLSYAPASAGCWEVTEKVTFVSGGRTVAVISVRGIRRADGTMDESSYRPVRLEFLLRPEHVELTVLEWVAVGWRLVYEPPQARLRLA